LQVIVILKELSRRRRWVALGVAFAALVVVGIAKEAPARVQWVATKQIVIDSSHSAVPDSSRGLVPLIPRAGIYAQLMTNPSVLDLIGKSAGIPGSQI
jgi:uncharacterized protein involved in exopolysaccharide biosynthesis